jgi:sulfatase modifying factor 1
MVTVSSLYKCHFFICSSLFPFTFVVKIDIRSSFKSDTIKTGSKTLNIYPHTKCWLVEFPQLANASKMSEVYFTGAYYDNYPVVGINWEQANAYCIWRSDRLNELVLQDLNGGEINDGFSTAKYIETHSEEECKLFQNFRLPSLNEWSLAAQSNSNFDAKYPWGTNSLTDEDGAYLANLGQIIDKNNYLLKGFEESVGDKIIYPKEVKSYQSYQGVYDMSGNVAEWVNTPTYDITERYDVSPTAWFESDTTILEKFVKGGSWADGPVYLSWKTNTSLNKVKSSSRIGFRVAMGAKEERSSFNLGY